MKKRDTILFKTKYLKNENIYEKNLTRFFSQI